MMRAGWVCAAIVVMSCGRLCAQEAGPAAEGVSVAAVEAATRLLKDPERKVRIVAARVLAERFSPPQVPRRLFADVPEEREEPKAEVFADATVDEAAGALMEALRDEDVEVLKEVAIAASCLPKLTPKVEALLLAGTIHKDRNVRWYVLQAVGKWTPDAKRFVPVLMEKIVEGGDDHDWYLSALGSYGRAAQPVLPSLMRLLEDATRKHRSDMVYAMIGIGIDEASAKGLAAGTIELEKDLLAPVFLALCSQPRHLEEFVERNPGFGTELHAIYLRSIFAKLCDPAKDTRELRRALGKVKAPPPLLMGILREERFLPELMEHQFRADAHSKTLIEACARACGQKPQRVVRLSEGDDGGFRPASAWPNTDPKREQPQAGHGDGFTPVLVTGKLRYADKSVPQNVRFFATNDRMLMGARRKSPQAIMYDQKTGDFVYLTSVFAAYGMGGMGEPGPYQTGSAQTLIEADGAKSLVVQFYDEMPHVEITLTPSKNQP